MNAHASAELDVSGNNGAHVYDRGTITTPGATASYTMNVNGEHRSTVEGNLGARWSW
ncbi:hypothetical protein [Paraburkholderia sediminicola]|uniref:hypothetical protein n=1 Tax=Paraburkholderia sediminicola TaxID=458836 RepID=UPI001583881D|nr:hypothetical protein [Paraburkholderia sediminicola]